MCFLPREPKAREIVVKQFEHYIKIEGQVLLGWRDVPTDPTGLGRTVLEQMPLIRQAVVAAGPRIPRIRILSSASCSPSASRPRIRWRRWPRSTSSPLSPNSICPASPPARWSIRACCWRTMSASTLSRPRQSAHGLGDCAGASAVSPPIPSQAGSCGAPLPLYRHLWRDQHSARQHVNWMNARRRTMQSSCWSRSRQDVAAYSARPVRHRLSRQCAGSAGGQGLPALAHAVMMLIPDTWARQQEHGCQAPCLLRISCRPAGARGTAPATDRGYRWPPDRPPWTAMACAPRATSSPKTISR